MHQRMLDVSSQGPANGRRSRPGDTQLRTVRAAVRIRHTRQDRTCISVRIVDGRPLDIADVIVVSIAFACED